MIEPAELAWDERGVPWSARFGDVFHSHDGGPGQARHVFLAGNDLPSRWRDRPRFTILETGFGLGLNFLTTWQAWRADPHRSARLDFVSVEKHPFRAADLARLHAAWPEFAPLSAALVACWPLPLPGLHRLHLDGGRVSLTLYLGEGADGLEALAVAADALYLDGFSPARNPELWSPRICHLLARCCAPGATLATWSVSGPVREALTRAGFDVAKAPGFGGKREMLRGHLGERQSARATSALRDAPSVRHALVIGAGLAGSAAAQRLAARGWRIELVDQAPGPGAGASGNLAGVLRPLPSLDDNRLSRLTRAGTLYGLHHLAALDAAGHAPRWSACGVLHLARDPGHEARQRDVVERHRPPREFLRYVSRDEAAAIAGCPVGAGGWWFPSAGWVMPPSLCGANLAAAGESLRTHFSRRLQRIAYREGLWHALDSDGRTIAAAPVAVLANGTGIRDLDQAACLPVRSARGQVTHLPARAESAPRVVVCRLGYVSPAIDGLRCAGATFQVDDVDPGLRDADQAENLSRLEFMLPGFAAAHPAPELAGRVGFRPASPDRLPIVGAVPAGALPADATVLEQVPRHQGLYAVSGFGARGLVWSALAGELLAGQLDGGCLPVERDIVAALDPARFVLKPSRRAIRNDE